MSFSFLCLTYNGLISAECSPYLNSTLIKACWGLKMGGNYTFDSKTSGKGRGADPGTIAHYTSFWYHGSGWGWGAGPRRGVLREEGVQVWAEQKTEHPSLATSCPLAQLSPYWTWQGGVRCGKALGIGQSDPFSTQQGQRGEGLHGQGAWGERVWEGGVGKQGDVDRACAGSGALQATWLPLQPLCWVGPQRPAPSPVPVSTYQEHEDDGALVDVVHEVAGLLPEPAPAKVGGCQ